MGPGVKQNPIDFVTRGTYPRCEAWFSGIFTYIETPIQSPSDVGFYICKYTRKPCFASGSVCIPSWGKCFFVTVSIGSTVMRRTGRSIGARFFGAAHVFKIDGVWCCMIYVRSFFDYYHIIILYYIIKLVFICSKVPLLFSILVYKYTNILVGGLEHFLLSHILGISSSQLTFIFFRRVAQPATSIELIH